MFKQNSNKYRLRQPYMHTCLNRASHVSATLQRLAKRLKTTNHFVPSLNKISYEQTQNR